MYYYSLFHVAYSAWSDGSFCGLSFIEREFKKKSLKTYYYPLAMLGIGILGLLATKNCISIHISLIINTPHTVFGVQTGGAATIGEVSSIFLIMADVLL